MRFGGGARLARAGGAAVWLACGLALALGGCGDGGAGDPAGPAGEIGGRARPVAPVAPVSDIAALPAPRATRGYVVISIDTLRADHLGCYGYPRPTSPFLDSLARRATLFEEAYAPFPSTLVSHMSMFTGLHPREHGVFPPNAVLHPDVETFPEVFQRHGFRTAGFTEGGYVSGRFGFRRGFDEFIARDRKGGRQVEQTFRRGLRFLASVRPGERFLLFLHTYAVHDPYDAPPRYVAPFWSGGPPPGAIPATPRALVGQNALGSPLPPPAVDWLTARYDAGIRQTDEVLGRFFAGLERLGLAADTTVVVTADHGEELQEHGRLSHTQLYREVMRVPLLVVHPDRRAAVRHGGVVGLVDLAPTLYELARIAPADRPTGVSLAGLLGRPVPPRTGTVWADNTDGSRAVYRGAAASLESLLLFDPPPGEWVARRAAVDAPAGELAFEARSFDAPRRLAVRQEGAGALAEVGLTPRWAPVRLALAAPARLLLEADACTLGVAEGKGGGPRCRGFQVRGLRLSRIELYDVARDPGQRRDLSRRQPRRMRDLLRHLLAFNPRPAAPAIAPPPLDAELEADLRALGYLQ